MSKDEKEVSPPEPKPTGPPKSVFREYFESFVVTLIMAIFGMTFVLQAVTVPTGSMQNTILIGDYLLVNKFIFAPGGKPLPFFPQREIQRGDIIVFKYPGNRVHPENDKAHRTPVIPYQVNYVKRVIGLPGDTVEFRNNQVFVNNQLLPEHRIIANTPLDKNGSPDEEAALIVKSEEPRTPEEKYDVYYSEETMKIAQTGKFNPRLSGYEFGVQGKPMLVPANNYFVMGDSRDNSEDSRYWGFVPGDLVIGRAMFVYWSCDRSGGESVMSCLTSPRLSRIGKLIK